MREWTRESGREYNRPAGIAVHDRQALHDMRNDYRNRCAAAVKPGRTEMVSVVSGKHAPRPEARLEWDGSAEAKTPGG